MAELPIVVAACLVILLAAAAPHTPLPGGILTQAGWPWNGPTTSSSPCRK